MKHIRIAQVAIWAAIWALAPASAEGFWGGPWGGLSASPDSVAQTGSGGNCTLCHDFNRGTGSVEILGVPPYYQPESIYDLIVRIADPAQVTAGFELSAENGPILAPAHQGILINLPDGFTKYSIGSDDFVTHSNTGAADAQANWAANGNAALYRFQWQAPLEEVGVVRFFVVGNAVNRNMNAMGDNMYIATSTTRSRPSGPGDVDRDGDVDWLDFQSISACASGPETPAQAGCEGFDSDLDSDVDLGDLAYYQDISTGEIPQDYLVADATRGGKIYDRWWAAIGAPPPAGNHPLYPPGGTQSGPTTFRCKECHGWDYRGADGDYASGDHYTGIRGVLGASGRPQAIFDLLKYDSNVTTNGHAMVSYGMSDKDLWDVTRFVTTELLDTRDYINSNGAFVGDFDWGQFMFDSHCNGCHGFDGTAINFGTPEAPEYVGTVAVEYPAEFLHKVRFGHPGSPMLSLVDLFTPTQYAADLGVYCQTLPTQ